jgi:hypothetical protein
MRSCGGSPGCVAVGASGEIVFSVDGSDWIRVDSSLHADRPDRLVDLQDVCFFNEAFIAVGGTYGDGRILRSTDGRDWQPVSPALGAGLTGIATGGGRVVAVGEEHVHVSGDGQVWERQADSPGLKRLAFGNGVWAAFGSGGKRYNSSDLTEWATRSFFEDPFSSTQWNASDIVFADGKFVLVGGYFSQNGASSSASIFLHSRDGISWSFGAPDDGETIFGVQRGVAFADGEFVVVGAGLFSSEGGELWTRRSLEPPGEWHTVAGSFTGVAGGEGRPFVAVRSSGEILLSEEGTSWTLVEPVVREYLCKVSFDAGRFVAVGGRSGSIGEPSGTAALFSSTDGVEWSAYIPEGSGKLSGIAYGEGIWVATGDDGAIYSSADALSWEDHSWPGTANDLSTLVHGAGRFIAFSRNRDRIYSSAEGTNWAISDGAPVADVEAAASIGGQLIAVGGNGLVATSTDGLTWIARRIHPSADFTGIVYAKGRYVIAGLDHAAFSVDLVEWEVIEVESGPREIVYAEGWFVGDDLTISRDGVHWQEARHTFSRPDRIESMLVVGEFLVSVQGLELWRSRISALRPEGLQVIPGAGVELMTRPDTRYRLLESSDLKNWTNKSGWEEGSGDYRIWATEFSGPGAFWRVKTAPAAIEEPH